MPESSTSGSRKSSQTTNGTNSTKIRESTEYTESEPFRMTEDNMYTEEAWYEKTRECFNKLDDKGKQLARSLIENLSDYPDLVIENALKEARQDALSFVTNSSIPIEEMKFNVDIAAAMGRQLALKIRKEGSGSSFTSMGQGFGKRGDWDKKYRLLIGSTDKPPTAKKVLKSMRGK